MAIGVGVGALFCLLQDEEQKRDSGGLQLQDWHFHPQPSLAPSPSREMPAASNTVGPLPFPNTAHHRAGFHPYLDCWQRPALVFSSLGDSDYCALNTYCAPGLV